MDLYLEPEKISTIYSFSRGKLLSSLGKEALQRTIFIIGTQNVQIAAS
jgi:hypothetical protein